MDKQDSSKLYMSFKIYHLYGLYLRSQWHLPCPELKESGLPEVRLLEGSSSLFPETYLKNKGKRNKQAFFHYTHLQDGSTYIRWSGLFEFLISDSGGSILGRQHNNTDTEAFINYLLGQVLSFAMIKQGIEPLHSTVVRVDGGAVGFIGDCGYGKSSLGASFLQAGFPLLTDDLLILKENNGCFAAYPGFPRIKLFPKIAKKLIGENVESFPMNNVTSKLILPLDRYQFARTTVPLRSIYVLAPPAASLRSKKVSIRRLSQRRAFLSLLRNTFNTKVTEPERLKGQFTFFTQIVSKVPIKTLSYPRSLKSLPLVREAILDDLKHGDN
ncbi:MAG: hypothetical protein ACFFCW_38730 [Candidatus Hodarchaeota archaeon]